MRRPHASGAALAGAACLLASVSASAHGSDPDTLVVGDQGKSFGVDGGGLASSWSSQLPPFVLTFSLRSISHALSSSDSFDGNVETSPLAYKFSGDALGKSLRTYGFEMGAFWYPTPFTYVGPSVGLGFGKYDGPSFVADSLTIAPRDTLNDSVVAAGGVAGLRLPLGLVSIRTELLAGGQWISIEQYASNTTNRLTSTASAVSPLFEPRATVDLWVTPFVTVSLFAAMPSFEPSATDAGVVVSAHLRAFDGKYGLF